MTTKGESQPPGAPRDPIARFLRHQRVMILDGGLATALEAKGCDLNHDLWSAKVLMEAPELIREVHLDFLESGADCICSASYQATVPGFRKQGLTDADAGNLLVFSVELAKEARDQFWADPANRRGRQRPLVAASIGPFGAFLADGSEYSGTYGLSIAEIYEFHRDRWEVLTNAGADLLACETIPSEPEARALLRLLGHTPETWAWMSFSCRDRRHLSDGTPLTHVAWLCDEQPRVAAVGVNCTPPELMTDLIREVRKGTGKPVVVYPNSGEEYRAEDKTWHTTPSSVVWRNEVARWVQAGARLIGGCCRVGPGAITEMRRSHAGHLS
jgi:homocysteine S-methyltransferase